MNEKLKEYLGADIDKYPHALEAQHPRILEKIVELWSSPKKISAYFEDLLIDQRGNRKGFSAEIAREIFKLSLLSQSVWTQQEEKATVWVNKEQTAQSKREAQRELDRLGLKLTPSHMLKAAEFSDPARILLFLKAGMDVDVRDEREWTPLMVAAFNGNEVVAKLLIQHGANPNALDRAGYAPLHWAALNGFEEVVRLLIDKGVDRNARSKFGITALMQTASGGHCGVLTLLLQADADPDLASDDGLTPLHKAVANGHAQAVEILLKAGASILLADKEGKTPLSIADKSKHPTIIKMLRQELKLPGYDT
ncbi:MAG: ankyrin repeat domain-containing protein [Burkholderiales bacterium]